MTPRREGSGEAGQRKDETQQHHRHKSGNENRTPAFRAQDYLCAARIPT
jgi:hypothetical protein|tara:strand:- start:87197 stop:87343 length:147 start_codon:yes stop_codon:yes gene_type:complete